MRRDTVLLSLHMLRNARNGGRCDMFMTTNSLIILSEEKCHSVARFCFCLCVFAMILPC